ncbi:1394_t:CDS:2 [Funneliformis mosseae]|uniref:non-specific serine/threonine protein kinase n=1 Tax=Funneliformis mosseae TaxID=27381 RepID=A0A9N8VS63_FUNMO|nr:1394_t:CDS:2 [Funneliformis mosseae]
MRLRRLAFTPVCSFLLWALIICTFFLFPYAKSRLDSKDLIQFRPPFYKRLVSEEVKALPPKLNLSPINLVLISTLDGNLHGVDRYTGQIIWSLKGAAEGSLIRTYTRSSTKQHNVTRNKEENNDIVRDGDNDDKFPYTVKYLVMNSPFRSADGKIFIVGSKSTKFLAIDPATGKILQFFSSDGVEKECPSMGSVPRDAIFMGINVYKISIFERGIPKWNTTYTEYVPHSFDLKIEQLHKTSPDDLYIASTHNGEVLSTESSSGQHAWYHKFSSPAVNVFDVLASKDLPSGLHIVRQPRPSDTYHQHLKKLHPSSQLAAYIGDNDGTLFAMSVENYPLTQFIADSLWFDYYNKRISSEKKNESQDNGVLCRPGSSIYPACLIGKHNLVTGEPQRPGIEGPPVRKNINPNGFLFEPEARSIAQIGLSWAFIIFAVSCFVFLNKVLRNGSHRQSFKKTISSFLNFKTQYAASNNELKDEDKGKFSSPKVQFPKEVLQKTEVLEDIPVANPQSTTSGINSTEQSINTNGEIKLNSLIVSDIILGYGSHGTIVYKGTFEGRDVAIKRLLLDFYDVAHHEVSLLQESDDHPNVIRYFCKEQCDRFLYIALELCPASLHDLVERGSTFQYADLLTSSHPSKILHQIISGLHHLHSMKIVHRDIKPQNILISPSKHKRIIQKDGVSQQTFPVRVLISDFGLCKKLEGDSSSFHNTTNNAGGTIGWRAPELLSPSIPPSPDGNNNNNVDSVWTSVDRLNDNSFTSSSSTGSDYDNGQPRRVTKAIDIFSTGCLFYYVLSGGDHPFGDRYSREINILKGVYELTKLDGMGEEGIEAKDLIMRMIERDPKKRPKAETVMLHPYFWSPSKRLGFLQDASDRFEIEEREPPSPLLQRLEQGAVNIIGPDWYKRIDRVLVENLGKYRKYDGSRVRDLLRALRNKISSIDVARVLCDC